jgi:hypothetical protein
VGLNACFIEGFRPFPDCRIGIFTVKKLNLLEGSAVGFDPVETSHFYDVRGNSFQLFNTRLILARRLPHIAVKQTEPDLFLHIFSVFTGDAAQPEKVLQQPVIHAK